MTARVRLGSGFCEFACPGCGQWHSLPIGPNAERPRWAFSGDANSPTLDPSIMARGVLSIYDAAGEWTGEWKLDAAGAAIPYVCHSFLRNGRIEFLGDCTHALAGQTVELPVMSAEFVNQKCP